MFHSRKDKSPGAALRRDPAYLLDQLQRLQAEFSNYRKRAEKEESEAAAGARREMIVSLLPVFDAIERALAGLPAGRHSAPYREGIQAIDAKLLEVFGQAGLKRINPRGETFDPAMHEAIGSVRPRHGAPDGTIQEVLSEGYSLNGVVVRPARVLVAMSDLSDKSDPSDESDRTDPSDRSDASEKPRPARKLEATL